MERREKFVALTKSNVLNGSINENETKAYRVVAHCADGDVEIKPKGKDTFSTLKEAVEARDGHLDLCDDIEIIELTNC